MWLFNRTRDKRNANNNLPDFRIGYILFNTEQFDRNDLIKYLDQDWSINMIEKPTQEGRLVFENEGMEICCDFIPAPILFDDAIMSAEYNGLWKGSEELIKIHQSHMILKVIKGEDIIVRSLLFSKIAASMLKLDNAIGIYQNPTVMSSDFYIRAAQNIKSNNLPILNWVYIGIYNDNNLLSGYTYGLNEFGSEEVEVIRTKNTSDDLYDLLFNVASYIIDSGATLRNRETIALFEAQKLRIKRSKGVVIKGKSIKIVY